MAKSWLKSGQYFQQRRKFSFVFDNILLESVAHQRYPDWKKPYITFMFLNNCVLFDKYGDKYTSVFSFISNGEKASLIIR